MIAWYLSIRAAAVGQLNQQLRMDVAGEVEVLGLPAESPRRGGDGGRSSSFAAAGAGAGAGAGSSYHTAAADEEEAQAATMIQARIRGAQLRRQLEAEDEEEEAEEEDPRTALVRTPIHNILTERSVASNPFCCYSYA